MPRNCSSAVSRLSTISLARTVGSCSQWFQAYVKKAGIDVLHLMAVFIYKSWSTRGISQVGALNRKPGPLISRS